MRTRLVTDDAGFAALRERWDALLERAADANTFLSFAWLHSWWVAYRVPAELCLVLAEEGDELLGIAPMMLLRARRLGLPFRVLRFVGDGTSESDHMNLVLRADRRAEACASLLAALGELSWDAAHFDQVPEGSPTAREIVAWARSRDLAVDVARSPCPRRNLPASYADLLASLQSRFRTSLRSSRRKLGERYRLEFGLHERAEEFPEALAALYRNHASRWAAKGRPGVFGDPRKRDFYELLVRELSARGALRFYYLKLDGVVRAQQFCFAHGDEVFLLQEGFDAAHAEENLGNALRGMVFERLIAEGVRVYDFLAGDSRHKRLWSDAFPDDLRIEAARPTLRGRLYFQAPRRIEALKRVAKRALRAASAADAPQA